MPPPICVGEMYAHSQQINMLLKISEDSFISAGQDSLLLLWQSIDFCEPERANLAAKHFLEENPRFIPDENDTGSVEEIAPENRVNHTEALAYATAH